MTAPAWLFLSPVHGASSQCPDVAFEHTETPSAHPGLWNLAVGDLDADQDLDVVVVGFYPGMFSVLKNRGDGTFESQDLYEIGEDPRCVVLEDLDTDSDLDLIVSNSLGRTLFTYANRGNGVFDRLDEVYAQSARPTFFAAGDLDGDSDSDLVVNYFSYGSIMVLWNRGDGRFDLGPSYPILGSLYEVVARDFNGDHHLDIAVLALRGSSAKVWVLINDGSGAFGDLQGYSVPRNATLALASADLDNDGDLDLAGVRTSGMPPGTDVMWVALNDGIGHFCTVASYSVGRWPMDVSFGDLDRDGDLDAVVTNHRFADEPAPHDVSILMNRGDGTFEGERRIIVGYKPIAVLCTDLDGDLDLDIVTANGGWGSSSISVLFNQCDPTDFNRGAVVDLLDDFEFRGSLVTEQCPAADLERERDISPADSRWFQRDFQGTVGDDVGLSRNDTRQFHDDLAGAATRLHGHGSIENENELTHTTGEIGALGKVPSPAADSIGRSRQLSNSGIFGPSGSIVGWGSEDVGAALSGPFMQIDAGRFHSLGVRPDGSILGWGCIIAPYYDYGQCSVPAPNSGFVTVAAGSVHSLGLLSDGSILAWGKNDYGQTDVPLPNNGFVAVAAGEHHSLGLKSDGSIVAWGWINDCESVPAPNSDFVAIAAGWFHSLGLKSDGSIVAWGCDEDPSDYGQCNVSEPNSGFVAIATGLYHSLGVKADGSIVGWGDVLGEVPEPNSDFVAVAAGEYHSMGLKSDGSIVAWGYDEHGETNVPDPNNDFVALAAGRYTSLAIRGSKADYNSDGRFDTTDYAVFWSVIDSEEGGGPSVQPTVKFWYLFDMDGDGDVDLQDFALFENAFTGE